MILTFGRYSLDIDAERTREYYRTAERVTESCSCDGCRNFERAADGLAGPVREFFDLLGADPKKVRECYVNGAAEDGTLLYGGFCHLCGTLAEGESAWKSISDRESVWCGREAYPVTDSFLVAFQENVDLPEDGFPQPMVQMEFSAALPWVLEKRNPYLTEDPPGADLRKGEGTE